MNSSESSLSFRVVEPMMFRGPGEFDPSARGVQSYALSFNMPSPSTIAGAIATYMLGTKISSVKKFEKGEWVEQYRDVLGGSTVRGPFILFKDEIMVEDGIGGGFLNLKDVKEKCSEIKGNLDCKFDSLDKLDNVMSFGKIETKPAKVAKTERVGVGLKTRSESVKVADEDLGLLYNAQFTDYISKEVIKPNELREVAIEIIVDIKNAKITLVRSPIKLGGEGRVVLFTSSKTALAVSEIREKLWNGKAGHDGNLACYLATPALFKGGETVAKHVSEWAEGLNGKLVAIYGETDILGAGFSLYHQERKPIYSSLKPGSVIFLEGKFNLDDLYWQPNFGEASELGYGTIIPVIL